MTEGRERAAAVREYLEGRRDRMVDFLVELASLESPTDVPESQAPVQARLTRALEERGMWVRRVPGRLTGGLLYARPRRRVRRRPTQLIIGHSDTVWPIGTLAAMPVAVENGHVRGPGTFDMKAGLVQGIFAVEALAALGLEPPATPVWIVNSDEEIGSPESARWVRQVARRAARAYVLEPAYGPEGRLKTARKGVGRFRVTVRGIPAHAGLEPTAGASAIFEIADVVLRLRSLNDPERGTTLNVGTIRGGTRRNVVAAEATADVDLRVATAEDGRAVAAVIHAMQAQTPGTSIHVDGGLATPPLELTTRNRSLWCQALIAGQRLGLALQEYAAGGASDGNTTSQYTATLDGLGAIGDGAHARHESVSIAAMPERAALLAELLMAPVEGD